MQMISGVWMSMRETSSSSLGSRLLALKYTRDGIWCGVRAVTLQVWQGVSLYVMDLSEDQLVESMSSQALSQSAKIQIGTFLQARYHAELRLSKAQYH